MTECQEESEVPAKSNRKRNCKAFFKEGVCLFGAACKFGHDKRPLEKIMRYHHTAKLIKLERVNFFDEKACSDTTEVDQSRLPIFKQIQRQADEQVVKTVSGSESYYSE